MTGDVSGVILAIAALLMALSWWRPEAGAAFVVTGAIPYYALLNLLGIPTSGVGTALVYSSAGAFSIIRFASRGRRISATARTPVLLFVAFFVIWQLMWFVSPPQNVFDEKTLQFAERSQAFMVVFALLPFVAGSLMNDPERRGAFLGWVVRFGGASLLIVLFLAAIGRETQGNAMSQRWEPIAFLSGITLSIELGLACVAFVGVTLSRSGLAWTARRAAWILATIFIQIRVGQRGPLLFTVAALMAFLIANPLRRGLSRTLQASMVAIAIVGVAAAVAGQDEDNRALRASSYTAEGNEDRLALLELARRAVMERPIFGWGGELVGTPVGPYYWMFSHVLFLDPVIETGIVGAMPFVLLFGVIGARLRALWRQKSAHGGFAILPMFAFALMESLVSGHISSVKHLWLLAGVLASVGRSGNLPSRPVTARSGRPSGPVAESGARA